MRSSVLIVIALHCVAFVVAQPHPPPLPPVPDCANCVYPTSGLAYLPGPTCDTFYQCQKKDDGTFDYIVHCCPVPLMWSQDVLNCVHDPKNDCKTVYPDCPNTTFEIRPCDLFPFPNDDTKYIKRVGINDYPMDCSPGTVFSQAVCDCIHGPGNTCNDDPYLYFPFATHTNDIQCQKAIGTAEDNAYVDKFGSLCVDGDGDYVHFGLLSNMFPIENFNDFTISLWFKQTIPAFDNGNGAIEGLFGNGDCDQFATVSLMVGKKHVRGALADNNGNIIVEIGAVPDPSREYSPDPNWHQLAMRLHNDEFSLFLNGDKVGNELIPNTFHFNTQTASTIGMVYTPNGASFFHGCIDDVMVFNRFVDDVEMTFDVFSRDRTNGTTETPYP